MNDREKPKARPYELLGKHLKQFREQRSESLVEASGAVEIDAEVLERYEEGKERPSEDILMLLINHFNVQDQDAVQVWESAGYDSDNGSASDNHSTRRQQDGLEKAAVLVLAMDARTVYSDGIVIDGNQAGLVMNFTQAVAGGQQAIARVGMSYDQAARVLASLQQALMYGKQAGQPRRLPPSTR